MLFTTKKILAFTLCVLLLLSNSNQAWSRSVEKQAVLAVLTLNVARFTHWPEQAFNNSDSVLNLCVFGDNFVQESFADIDQKVINNKTVHIINLSRLRNLHRCQIIYLSELEQSKLISLLVEIKGHPVLTVGEKMSFLKAGGMVGLEQVNGKIQLTINLPMLKKTGIVISSRLLKLAKIVDFPISTE